jgi:hypothetical protein
MDTTRIESICDKILDNPTERYCEIYKITNIKIIKYMLDNVSLIF